MDFRNSDQTPTSTFKNGRGYASEPCGLYTSHHNVIGGETSRIGELFIDVSPPFLRVEMEWGVL